MTPPMVQVKYQPVSAGLDSRSGTEAEFRQMVRSCRAAGPRRDGVSMWIWRNEIRGKSGNM